MLASEFRLFVSWDGRNRGRRLCCFRWLFYVGIVVLFLGLRYRLGRIRRQSRHRLRCRVARFDRVRLRCIGICWWNRCRQEVHRFF